MQTNHKIKKIYPLDRGLLERKALHYLQKYGSTEAQLQRILMKRVYKARKDEEKVFPEAEQWIDEIVQKCVLWGYVNDERYAQQTYKKMRRQGKSKRIIEMKLKEKGVSGTIIEGLISSINEYESNQDERKAAIHMIRKKRLGAFTREDKELDFELKRKQMSKMARYGFSFHLIQELFELSQEQLLDLIYE